MQKFELLHEHPVFWTGYGNPCG